MRPGRPALTIAACWLLASAILADDRSTVRLRYSCSSSLGRRDVTLFANGTVRLRQGLWESQEMYLGELLPEEVASSLRRLEEILASADEAGATLPTRVVEGDWVETCEMLVALPGSEPWSYRFSHYEILPLHVASLIHAADNLAEATRPLDSPNRLPADYEPKHGDVLRTAEGERFLVLGLTFDRRAVELDGIDSPLRLVVAIEDLGEAFAEIEPPDRR